MWNTNFELAEQLKRAEEIKKVKEVKKEEPEDWQSVSFFAKWFSMGKCQIYAVKSLGSFLLMNGIRLLNEISMISLKKMHFWLFFCDSELNFDYSIFCKYLFKANCYLKLDVN